MTATAESRLVDGMPSSWVDLRAPGVELRWLVGGNWLMAERFGPELSYEFRHHILTSLRMQLFFYPAGSGLSDFSQSSIKAYLNGLPAEFPESRIKVSNFDSMQPEPGGLPFLNGNYRKLFFRVEPLVPGSGESRSVCEALTFTSSGGLLRLRVIGSESEVAPIRANFETELGRFIEP